MLNFRISPHSPLFAFVDTRDLGRFALTVLRGESAAQLSPPGLSSEKVKCIPHAVTTTAQRDALSKDSEFCLQTNEFQKHNVPELQSP